MVIVVLFFADLFMCPDKKSGRGTFNTALPVVLMAIHTVVTLMPGSESGEAFGDGDCIRINAALPHTLVREAMDRLEKYVFV